MKRNSFLRYYRSEFEGFNVTYKESDLYICSENIKCKKEAYLSLLKYRNIIEKHIISYPEFQTSLKPLQIPDKDMDEIIYIMYKAGLAANVGPFSSVAGVIAEYVAMDLKKFSDEIIVENGGDIFITGKKEKIVKILSLHNRKLGLKINGDMLPVSVCSSSSMIGHSLSFGKADLVVVLSKKGAYADAFATAICNLLKNEEDINNVIAKYESVKEIEGCMIFLNDKIGGWGNIEVVKIS